MRERRLSSTLNLEVVGLSKMSTYTRVGTLIVANVLFTTDTK